MKGRFFVEGSRSHIHFVCESKEGPKMVEHPRERSETCARCNINATARSARFSIEKHEVERCERPTTITARDPRSENVV
jgi:hypothetical protein